jgi:eukaryotic-like serine/threonine-protein kinase
MLGVIPPATAIPRQGKEPTSSPGVIPPATAIPRQGKEPTSSPSLTRGLTGRVVGDKYGITGLIGEGGMSAVYEAEHLAIGHVVAVKVLHALYTRNREAVSRFRHEARVAGTLGHPNICTIHDVGRLDDGSPYLVMERLHGESLAQRLERGRMAPSELVDTLVQVLSALVAAHHSGIIHRDLKPENVFLAQRAGMAPTPKLLDFGISKADGIEDTAVEVSDASLVAGTPYYLSPEQARGDRSIDHRVDLWAVGVMLYEGLAGARPFEARNYNALLVQILTTPVRPLREHNPKVPARLSAIVEKALAKAREDRYQSAAEFQRALAGLKLERASRPSSDGGDDYEDETVVFSREEMGLSRPVDPSASAPEGLQEDPDGSSLEAEGELTIVDPPSFLNDSITLLRRDAPKVRNDK